MTTKTLKVGGMTCNHCVMAVTRALKGLQGVQDASVDLQSGRAVVNYDESLAGVPAMVAAIEEEGYTAQE